MKYNNIDNNNQIIEDKYISKTQRLYVLLVQCVKKNCTKTHPHINQFKVRHI